MCARARLPARPAGLRPAEAGIVLAFLVAPSLLVLLPGAKAVVDTFANFVFGVLLTVRGHSLPARCLLQAALLLLRERAVQSRGTRLSPTRRHASFSPTLAPLTPPMFARWHAAGPAPIRVAAAWAAKQPEPAAAVAAWGVAGGGARRAQHVGWWARLQGAPLSAVNVAGRGTPAVAEQHS